MNSKSGARILRPMGIVGVVALAVLAATAAVDRGSPVAERGQVRPTIDATNSHSRRTPPSGGGIDHADHFVIEPDIAEPAEDPVSASWDDLTPSERVKIQKQRFADALARARRGEDVERSIEQAGDALTALRPELYASVEGRAEHLALEARLDDLVEGQSRNEARP